MDRLFGILLATGWFALLSASWLGAVGLSALFLLRDLFAFNPLLPSAWQALIEGFRQGQAVPLSFILLCLALAVLGLTGQMAILWRLPTIVGRLPSFTLPRLSVRLPKLPSRGPRPRRIVEPTLAPPPPPAPAPAPTAAPQSAPPPAGRVENAPPQSNDAAILARILALFEVWDEPPPSWMAEALRDEIHLLSPEAWPTLETLGSHGLELLVTLQEHGMLPESPAALRAIGEVEEALRTGLAAEAVRPETASSLAVLTLAASWLCEALENFLAAQASEHAPPAQLTMAQEMLEQAMRAMGEGDWASLDQFPEKASRVRVLTDRLREDLRKAGPPKPVAAAPLAVKEMIGEAAEPLVAPIEAVVALLSQLGFTLEGGGNGLAEAPLLAERADLLLLLQAIDLDRKTWRLPQGLLGAWLSQDAEVMSPGRQLWQLLARRRLRRADPRPLAGLLVLHGGSIEREESVAELVAADRRRSGIGLAWLDGTDSPLPTLERELHQLLERAARERFAQRSENYSASTP